MKYYNNEVEQHKREEGSENDALEVLGEVRKSIEESLKLLKQML